MGSPSNGKVDGARAQVAAYRSAAEEGYKFEYLDHTADVQLHAWGSTLEEAFEGAALAMFNYMTPLSGVTIDELLTREYKVEGHDLQSLLYNFLDELLFIFATELFVCSQIKVTKLDREAFTLTAQGRGEVFQRGQHASGTEVKAITYSAMQINEEPHNAEVFVIVDI